MRQIARELKHSRKTVKKGVERAEPEGYQLKEPRDAPVLGRYKARLTELLEENERLPRKQRRTYHQIYKKIQQEGYQGSESGVHVYLWQQRKAGRGWSGGLGRGPGDPGRGASDGANFCAAAVLLAQNLCDGLSPAETGSLFRRTRGCLPSLWRSTAAADLR